MFGTGNTCWIAQEVGTKKKVVIKDKWHEEGCDSEADLLLAAGEAAVRGVACLLAVDETFSAKQPLTTSLLRQSQCLDTTSNKNQVFSRIVLEIYGPSIQHFRSGLQLLQAFRDSIQSMFSPFSAASLLTPTIAAHHHLVKAGILHRDISAENIRLGPMNAPPGQCAILLDLAQGSHCERGKPPSQKDAFVVRLLEIPLCCANFLLRGHSCFAPSTTSLRLSAVLSRDVSDMTLSTIWSHSSGFMPG